MKIKVNIKSETMFSLLVYWIWSQPFIIQYLKAFIGRIPIVGVYETWILNLSFMILIIGSIKFLEISKVDVYFLLFVIIVYVSQWIFNNDKQLYLSEHGIEILLKMLPLYLIGTNLGKAKIYNRIVYNIYIISVISLLMDIFYKVVISDAMSEVVSQYQGDMDRAYKILPYCCLIVFFAVKKTNSLNVFFSVIGGCYLLLLGTRGAAFLYLGLILLLLVEGKKSKGTSVRILIAVIGGISFLISPLYRKTLFFFREIANQVGLSVRIFDKLLIGEIGNSVGRNTIQSILLDKIWNGPIFGSGLFADRFYAGNYAHNIIIEFWVDFGVILGSILIVMLGWILVNGYLKEKSEQGKGFVLILIVSIIGKLFLSGTYLEERLFFFLIGLCVGNIKKSKYYCNGT